jgi:hypothetical protein
MFTTPDLQAAIQKRVFANMPASVRQAYDDANADFRRRLSQAVKSAATPETEVEPKEAQERAAVVLNLANALKRARDSRTNKTMELIGSARPTRLRSSGEAGEPFQAAANKNLLKSTLKPTIG